MDSVTPQVSILFDDALKPFLGDLLPYLLSIQKDFSVVHPEDLCTVPDGTTVYALLTEHVELLKKHESRLRIVNSVQAQEIATNKIRTSEILLGQDIPTPDTLISDSYEDLVSFVREHGDLAVLKSIDGCGGDNHFILRYSQGALYASIEDRVYPLSFGATTSFRDGESRRGLEIAPPHYAQAFISLDGEKNNMVYRTYIIGTEIPFGTMRVKDGVERAEDSIINIAKGARYEFMDGIPEEMIEITLRTADALGLEIGAIDLVSDGKNYYVLEANCDGYRMLIDRKFKSHPEFKPAFDLDRYITKRLIEISQGAHYRV